MTSFAANNGDTEAIARDLAEFIGGELGDAVLASSSGSSEITANSSGERVAGVQQSLIELGYLPDDFQIGEFDQATAAAVDSFQEDQINALLAFEGQPSLERPEVIGDSSIAQQITDLRDERFRGVVGEITAKLLERPLGQIVEVPASSCLLYTSPSPRDRG